MKTQKPKFNLTEGNKTEHNILINSKHEYNLSLKKGQFGIIHLQQKGMDVKIVSYDPEGKEIEEFDTPNGAFGSELILIDADKSGIYKLKIIPLGENKEEKKGSYTIEFISSSNSITSHLDKVFKLIGKGNHIPGFFVSIVDKEKILYSNGQGFANIEKQTPYTINTIQQIESISKTFLGLSIMLLVEEGKLDLDKDINDYLPFRVNNPFYPKKPITLRHLATHTASINDRNQHENFAWIENKEVFEKNKTKYIHEERRKYYKSIMGNKETTMEAFLKSYLLPKGKNYSKENFFKRKPGKEWYYSNVGATLAAYIVQIISKQPYNEFVEKNIIDKLKLEHTTWGYNPKKEKINSLKYGSGKNEYPRIISPTYPDGGIYSNTTDLSKYLMHWIKGYSDERSIVKPSSYKEIMSIQFEQKKGDYKGLKNGLFWWIFNQNRMGHNGGNMGSNANMFFYPELGIGYTSLENITYGEDDEAEIQSIEIKKILNRYPKYFKTDN
ncbi:hypothetical protein BTO18_08820 [Polaribacter porphyrae]|uniref:Beta-lactamase-related domain-containing protein n=1 Tax=Polaribacter porphyrae TaxID=1137780 RepID=A0A2S7WNT0_9FLAO|nr:hypothetical protein BTO18_08820 [Polaribacter porphyrae]